MADRKSAMKINKHQTVRHPFHGTRTDKPIWILMELMGWQWHQLDRMQVICTSLSDG